VEFRIVVEREVVKEEVTYKGKVFRRYPASEHASCRNYFRSTDGTWLHRMIWEESNGPMPDGHEIHHKDHNPLNNSLDNLECLEKSAHKSYHAKMRKGVAKTDPPRPKPGKRGFGWHQTEEGKYWHKKIGKLAWEYRVPVEKECLWCMDTFRTKVPTLARWCSRDCYFDEMRQTGGHDEVRICKNCGTEFQAWKYGKTQCCSISCSRKQEFKMRHDGLNYDGTPREKPFKYKVRRKICEFCGEIFERSSRSPENRYCGRACGFHAKMIDSDSWVWAYCQSCQNGFMTPKRSPAKTCKDCKTMKNLDCGIDRRMDSVTIETSCQK